ncbi:phospholipase A1-IIgamma-like [Lycium barbarum]|uniref:phospholipase A1-IIgamma-like n=1 Tax=Lycium barbarum TaxID=112863 RepID=UPI00293E6899|nr:phospholipase A1-IIgamma-like [Lycium barbarum]XP_060195600.1 phospholipase A1-IIgamma-like [Lycium barbarum]
MANMAEKWEELSGKNNWDGLLEPLDVDLRRYLIQYGELAHVTYDTFISDPISKNVGASRYSMENLLARCGLDPLKYKVTKYFYATSSILLPRDFHVKSSSCDSWWKKSNFMGYIAVATDEGKVSLGRRDIVIAWRGTIQTLEWWEDCKFLLIPGIEVFLGASALHSTPLLHHGFYSMYTSKDSQSKFNKTSARHQVIEEVKRLVEEYKDEEVSITVTGHSLGASLATLNAADIAYNEINKSSTGKEFPVTAFVFASPKVGDYLFQNAVSQLKHLHILRIRNEPDIVPKLPNLDVYFEVGKEIIIDTTKSPYLKLNPGDLHTPHNLEGYLHGIDGTQGSGDFKLEVHRDLALVNRVWDILKDEYHVPGAWWIEKNKGMVQQKDGTWLLMDREDYDF